MALREGPGGPNGCSWDPHPELPLEYLSLAPCTEGVAMEMLTALRNYGASRHLCNYCTEASGMQTVLGYSLCLTCSICLRGKAPEDGKP